MEETKIALTKSGYEKTEKELRELIDVVRPQVIEELKAARAQGDLSENADYDAARAKQAEVEGRIRQLEAILQNAEIISEVNSKEKKVRLGSTVEILDLSDNSTASYKIVGSVEANPFQGSISNECALGIALVGSKVNDVVTVKAESPYDVKVLKILND
ncbi:MAG: transcription elongation factor GreA [Bacilli bacterium]|nr:transcription elongation factor GreA [Bacilli bacterium]